MAAISLASGYITKPAIPHMILNAFKNLASVTFDSDYSFKQADKMKDAAKNAVAASSSAKAPVAAAKKEAVKEEPKEEAADVDMGGLFGEEYWGARRDWLLYEGEIRLVVWKISAGPFSITFVF